MELTNAFVGRARMFERFTERARQVILLAQEETRNLHHSEIDSGHILIGLIREQGGVAAQILKELEFTTDNVRAKLPPKGDETLTGQIPFTPQAKKVLEDCLREALALGHTYIGTEHVLLSLARRSSSDIKTIFEHQLGRRWEEIIRLEILELLRGPNEKAINGAEKQDNTEAQDLIIDFLTGFKRWHDEKILHKDDISDADETLIRWVEASRLNEYL